MLIFCLLHFYLLIDYISHSTSNVIQSCLSSLLYENMHTSSTGDEDNPQLVIELAAGDLVALADRDPACESKSHAFVMFKGFMSIQAHRVAHACWTETNVAVLQGNLKGVALLLQSRTSQMFSVDIHPAANIGSGLVIDHAHSIVIGETAALGDNCTILHGVTLGELKDILKVGRARVNLI